MAPRAQTAPAKKHRRQPGTGSLDSTLIVKKSSRTRKSLRLQNKRPVSHAAQTHPVQSSTTPPAPIYQPARTKRKRSQDSEAEADELKDERPAKQHRKSTPTRLEPSEENLQKDSEAEAQADE